MSNIHDNLRQPIRGSRITVSGFPVVSWGATATSNYRSFLNELADDPAVAMEDWKETVLDLPNADDKGFSEIPILQVFKAWDSEGFKLISNLAIQDNIE